jgi:hypothetical protein
MSFIDLRTRFMENYRGDIKDPILNMLLDTMDAYLNDVQEKMLFSAYSYWNNDKELPDGFFEVLRRNLFGQMFPGPAIAIAQASLREVKNAEPLKLESYHHLSVQDTEGNKKLFSPQYNSWLLPSLANDVKAFASGEDMELGFTILPGNLNENEPKNISIYADNVETFILERIRCRIAQLTGFFESSQPRDSVFRGTYPMSFSLWNDFFQAPYRNNFLYIPISVFFKKGLLRYDQDIYWLKLPGLGAYAAELNKKLTMNAFLVWNMTEMESTIFYSDDGYRYHLKDADFEHKEIIINSVKDIGKEPPQEYYNSAAIMDSSYPYQYTAYANKPGDEVIIAVNPVPEGDLKISYYQYDISETIVNLPAGLPFTLYKGLEERLHNVQSITLTSRNDAIADKKAVWDYFRSMIASRNRWLTKDDIKAAVRTFPSFNNRFKYIDFDNIGFEEKVGRVKGFLTPFTEISVPVTLKDLLRNPDRVYFERELGLYLKSRTVSGNFLQVKFIESRR